MLFKRLNREQIALYDLKKVGARLQFSVDDDNAKKVFAIFNKPCYNTIIIEKSGKNHVLDFVKRRFGVVVGVILFALIRLFSDFAILRIDVVGTGSYLKNQVVHVLNNNGAHLFGTERGFNYAVARSQIMALPSVTFCDIVKRGATLTVNVQADGEQSSLTNYGNLIADKSGKVIKLVVVCGTPLALEGEDVKRGDKLIGAYYADAQGENKKCTAVGYALLSCQGVASFYARERNEQNDELAMSVPLLYSERAQDINFTVKKEKDGVVYEISFSYLHTLKINLE